jgi:redox-sensitive bicupin YhaK (pirin superfamily)
LIDGVERISHPLAAGRSAYAHVARGTVTVNSQPLVAGDALKASGESTLTMENGAQAEVLLFDLK